MDKHNTKTTWIEMLERTKDSCYELAENMNILMECQNDVLQNELKLSVNTLLKEDDYVKYLNQLMVLYNNLKSIENDISVKEDRYYWHSETGEIFIVDMDNLLYSPETEMLLGIRVKYNNTWVVTMYNL